MGGVPADLSAIYEAESRRVLLESPLAGLAPDEIVVDLFCGGGGATQGIEEAGLVVHECVNHCASAIATHTVNHPRTNHRQGDVWKNTPVSVASGRPVGLLWASPDCRHFSRARGAAPVSKRVRDLAWVVIKWATMGAVIGGRYRQITRAMKQAKRPRIIIVENVPEFLSWGPVRARRHRGREVKDAAGRVVMEPVPGRECETFRRWRRMLERAGYQVDHRVLDAADYGAASRRKRLYVIARRDGLPIVWPEASHGAVKPDREGDRTSARVVELDDRRVVPGVQCCRPNSKPDGGRAAANRRNDRTAEGDQERAARARAAYRTAAEVIDWSDLGTSIFERPRALRPKTLARIAEGIRRYVLNDPAPFTLRVTHTAGDGGARWKVYGIDDPMPTQSGRQDMAVCCPIVAPQNTGVYGRPADQTGPTITTHGHQSLISALLVGAGGSEYAGTPRPVHRHLNTVKGDNSQSLVVPVMAHLNHGGKQVSRCDELGRTVVSGGLHQGLVSPLLMSAGGPECRAVPSDRPLGTVLPRDHRALVAALMIKFYGSGGQWSRADAPLGTVTTIDRHGLVCVVVSGVEYVIVDILFRMLRPRELARAMGFSESYTWPATQREAVRLIGNAVSPPQAAALVRAVLPRGRMGKEAAA
jgi:DNA (cytosine-5)-methyltransferase 1